MLILWWFLKAADINRHKQAVKKLFIQKGSDI